MSAGGHADEASIVSRMSRQKVRIHRDKLFESMVKIMEMYGTNSKYMLEIEFYDEVGSGLGPTLEFYSLVSHEWQRKSLCMWRECAAMDSDYVPNRFGLFPAPLAAADAKRQKSIIRLFKTLGIFVAKSLIDFRLIDVPFNREFMQQVVFGGSRPSGWTPEPILHREQLDSLNRDVARLVRIDEPFAKGIQHLMDLLEKRVCGQPVKELENAVSALYLDFTMPGHAQVKLVPSGDHKPVTIQNLDVFIQLVIDSMLYRGIDKQVRAFRKGFGSILPIDDLKLMGPDELIALFSSGVWEGFWVKEGVFYISFAIW